MKLITAADSDPRLAHALGRFSQACNYLEDNLTFVITRLLPITKDMGRVLLAGNQMRRNVEILRALLLLPDIPIDDATRDRLRQLLPRIEAINADRARFLHNKIIGEPTTYHLVLDKQDGKSSAAMPITIELIDERTQEAKQLWTEMYVAPVDYDHSKWGMEFPRYPVKDYPKR